MQRKFQNLRCILEICLCIENKKDLQKEGAERSFWEKSCKK